MKCAFFRLLAPAVIMAFVSGCTGISYYAQSVNGHLEILSERQDVEALAADPAQPVALRSQMILARDIRQFATDRLALPDNDSYRSYHDTGREYVTWAAFAAPEFSLDPKTSCFPIFGCVPYRGYFSEDAANEHAAGLQEQGFDIYVAGIPAYSTLGLTGDPLLNTMFRYDETYLAGVVFHELAHQRVYLANDTAFNEAFAVAVERSGVKHWLRDNADPAAIARYEAREARYAEFLSLLMDTRDELGKLYQRPLSEEQMRAAKAEVFNGLRQRYFALRDGPWGGFRGYDGWFEAPVNNARLALTSVYNDLVPDFLRLLELCSGNYERFYKAVERLGALDKTRRTEALQQAKACA